LFPGAISGVVCFGETCPVRFVVRNLFRHRRRSAGGHHRHQPAGPAVDRRTHRHPAIGSNRLVAAPGDGPLWARYYEIGTDRPIFGDRDRSIHDDVNEISQERRNGYSWYRDSPRRMLERFAQWSRKYPQLGNQGVEKSSFTKGRVAQMEWSAGVPPAAAGIAE
jgi:hypothetical protein